MSSAGDFSERASSRGDGSVDGEGDERFFAPSRGLSDALRGAASGAAQVAAGALVLLPLLLAAAAACFLLLRWLAAPPSHVSAVRPLHFDYTAAAPVATAAFLPPKLLLNGQLAPGTPPTARFLPPGQAFDLTLRLELPDSPVNQAVGVFQVRASLLTARGEVVAAASRPAQLRYRSAAARWARAAARAPLLALGWAAEAQTLHVPMFEAFPEQRGAPFAALRVELLPRADGGGAAPHVYAASAALQLRLGLLRHALHYWPITSALFGIACFFGAFVAAAASALALRRALPLLRGGDDADGMPPHAHHGAPTSAAATAGMYGLAAPAPAPPLYGHGGMGTARLAALPGTPSEGATSDGEAYDGDELSASEGGAEGDAPLSPPPEEAEEEAAAGPEEQTGLRQRRSNALLGQNASPA